MTPEEAKKIIIKERDSLKANPMVKVDDCLYEAFDMAIEALDSYKSFSLHKEFIEYMKNNPVGGYSGDNHNW